MISFSKFAENVQNGRITISKVNDAFALTKKQYNADTGEEIDAEVVALDPKELIEQKQKQLEIIAQIDAVLAEIKKIN
jgi:polysaccharide pyruvyl transferase WcaK-like protein